MRWRGRPPSLRWHSASPDPFQGTQPLRLLHGCPAAPRRLMRRGCPRGDSIATREHPGLARAWVWRDRGSPAISPHTVPTRSRCGRGDQPACVWGGRTLCREWVSRRGRPTPEKACRPGVRFTVLVTARGSHLPGISPCSRELFAPSPRPGSVAFGEGSGGHRTEGVGMWQPLSGCGEPPGREAGVGVTGEGFLGRKAPVGPREKPSLGEGRERRCLVGNPAP